LWSGGYRGYQGKHLTLEDAKVFDLPRTPPGLVVAAGGPVAAGIAAELADALMTNEPNAELVSAYRAAGGAGATYCEVPLAWAPDADSAAASARSLFRFAPLGWKVLSELPNPVNLEAAASLVSQDDMAELFGCGPEPEEHVAVAQQFVDAGFDHLALISAGPDVDGFFDFARDNLVEQIRALEPTR
jgi:G6PDH family F420-dependent oxidoreductase